MAAVRNKPGGCDENIQYILLRFNINAVGPDSANRHVIGSGGRDWGLMGSLFLVVHPPRRRGVVSRWQYLQVSTGSPPQLRWCV